MECTWDAALLQRGNELPTELLQVIQDGSNEQYLHAITVASHDPRYTYALFAHCEHIFAHVCATLRTHGSLPSAVATLGRIVPFAPYLIPYAEQLLAGENYAFSHSRNSNEDLLYLLGVFRLFSFEWRTFKQYINPTEIVPLLESPSRPVVYLAIRILQLYLSGADHWFEQMVIRYLGEDSPEGNINGQWDDKVIDYRFLTLWEEDRFRNVLKLLDEVKSGSRAFSRASHRVIPADSFDLSTALVGGILLPRLTREDGIARRVDDNLVQTSTINSNLRKIAYALKAPRPVLLTGLAGSGKTLLVRHVAQKLDKLDQMVILHLNEQSDAKSLIGIYTTGDTPGSFEWKPGVLSTAVQEGLWVLIEDLDRAPNEIIGMLLPLIEKGELVIPSRKQTIHSAQGFRIIATVGSTMTHRGEETKPMAHMLGMRHWQKVAIEMLPTNELRDILRNLYPSLAGLVPQFMAVYQRLQAPNHSAVLVGQIRTGLLRAISPRDLLKWCGRTSNCLLHKNALTSNDIDNIFMEAIDCFVGALPDVPARHHMAESIAEELRIDPSRRDHLLGERDVRYDVDKARINVGRYSLTRSQLANKAGMVQTSFSTNPHTNRMLEKVAAAIVNRESLLLVGETGVGKTTAVQHLAGHLGKKLVPMNLSQQSEAGDLLGGFKPISARSLVVPMKDEFDELFAMSFSFSKNQYFLDLLGKQTSKSNWKAVCKLWRQALRMVDQQRSDFSARQGQAPSKKRKIESKQTPNFPRWDAFAAKVTDLERRLAAGSDAFVFKFVEGNIVKALRNGDWVLLDEVNLASPDTLESIADLLDPNVPSLLLTESGSMERIEAHPGFRLFAAMNPATDVGKKDLPPGIRSRFTELFVESPDKDLRSLQSIVHSYLRHETANDRAIPLDTSTLYQSILGLVHQNKLVDGAGQKPHFSLRTLTRTLSYAKYIAPICSVRRALYEGFQMNFMTFLDSESARLIQPLFEQKLFGKRTDIRAELQKALRKPTDSPHVHGYPGSKHWVRQGSLPIEHQPHYILTQFIRCNLENLVRATSTRQFPVLIQGPTSSGKTSMIEYLAKRTGHKFVRINNHEHTDLQEYLGTYVSGTDGRLQFQEGLLVKALREGHWIVLDELNLAPTDVLEALNRLLDDNRELLIPETQEVVRPHENFMLFATQNPAGLYGGRKTLSRAFRNRFLELHFNDIPIDELQEILHQRTKLPESRCKRIVAVYKEVSVLRQENRLFEQKSFATLRDLFRWALRPNDTIEKLAANGFMLLAERVRKADERQTLKDSIRKVMSANGPRVNIDESLLYAEDCPEVVHYRRSAKHQGVVWTRSMRRLYSLVTRAMENNEPVLLVGETGCGKTSVCQMLADAFGKELHSVNAHQNTETGDLIGSQRPVRNRAVIEANLRHQLLSSRLLQYLDTAAAYSTDFLLDAYDGALASLTMSDKTAYCQSTMHVAVQTSRTRLKALFEWVDGSLVQAMKQGAFFLLDEISLADDSVLERINSVLESQRSILLAEKGSLDTLVTASPGFQFLATMNPGGDYGKRELSPALRNRFTEIWVPPLDDYEDVTQIVREKLTLDAKTYSSAMVTFAHWFREEYNTSASSSVSIRDALSWVSFVNRFAASDVQTTIVHGAAMIYIDTLGANPAGLMSIGRHSIDQERGKCLDQLSQLAELDAYAVYTDALDVGASHHEFTAGPFSLQRRTSDLIDTSNFSFDPPTTKINTMRVIRALQLSKPVMLEGNPGVGKTALVTGIADAVGVPLTRVNLSEQTDLLDLFGSDVPVEGADIGTFTWRDAPFLRAMKNGEWVLLDEMNLASQSVLEGLNACLDHRGEIYVPELGQSFTRHPDFRLFAAQNPHHQGGGRKGLPASFVNRFTVVFADAFRFEDLMLISRRSFPQLGPAAVEKAISFVVRLDHEVAEQKQIGANGAPWEFNLRDISRLLSLAASEQGFLKSGTIHDFVDLLFLQRFRSPADRDFVGALFSSYFGDHIPQSDLFASASSEVVQLGIGILPRDLTNATPKRLSPRPLAGAHNLRTVQCLMICIQQRWPTILTGTSGVGKTVLLERVASAVGATLVTIAMNAESDSTDLIGGYDQANLHRRMLQSLDQQRTRLDSQAMLELMDHALPDLFATLESCITASTEDIVSLPKLLASEFSSKAESVPNKIQNEAQTADKAQFEWIDGVLIDALQDGKWVVLDNANLCSPSVLDRLNSLLEPNGVLTVNERTNVDGSPRVIKPHPDFRIFLTVNPRYGELSRAMRNRAVELHLPDESTISERLPDPLQVESTLSRLHQIGALSSLHHQDVKLEDLSRIVADHMRLADVPLLNRLSDQINIGLHSLSEVFRSNLSTAWSIAPELQAENIRAVQVAYEASLSQTQVPADFARVQTIHPLNNQALIQLSHQALSLASSTAFGYDLSVHLHSMNASLDWMQSNLALVAELNRFERSLKLKPRQGHVLTKANGVLGMLKSILDSLFSWLGDGSALHDIKLSDVKLATGQMTALCTLLLETIKQKQFDAATINTLLSVGQSVANSYSRTAPLTLSICLTDIHRIFSSMVGEVEDERRRTCVALWKTLRPATPATAEQLDSLLRLEKLVERFDYACCKFEAPLDTIADLRISFSRALRFAAHSKHDYSEMSSRLELLMPESTIEELGSRSERLPHFYLSFRRLCDHFAVCSLGNSDISPSEVSKLEILALRRTHESILHASTPGPRSIGSQFRLLGSSLTSLCDEPAEGSSGILGATLLQQLMTTEQVSLSRLELLDEEIRTLGFAVSSKAHLIAGNELISLDLSLRHFVSEVLRALSSETNDEGMQQNALTLLARLDLNIDVTAPNETIRSPNCSPETPEANPPLHNLVTAITYLRTDYSDEQVKLSQAVDAWASFSCTCLQLYVPQSAFDPALDSRWRRDIYRYNHRDLTSRLRALCMFRTLSTGERETLRGRLLQDDIVALGQEPPTIQVCRPEVSRLSELQSDLDGLMRTLQPLCQIARKYNSVLPLDSALLSNVIEIRTRLSEQYRSYDDFTTPIVGFIDCLVTAHRLGVREHLGVHRNSGSSYVASVIPFVGATLNSWLFDKSFVGANHGLHSHSEVLLWLSAFAVRSVERPLPTCDPELRQSLEQRFYQFYLRWRTELQSEQKKVAEKSSLYKFRQQGSVHDEPTLDELEALFPTIQAQENAERVATTEQSARDSAHLVARLHATIFAPQSNTSDSMPGLLHHWLRIALKDHTEADERMIPTIIREIGVLSSSLPANGEKRGSYDIYTDCNIAEIKKLLRLLKKVGLRFRELRGVWSEHATPAEVLRLCDEMLQIRHSAPLAQLLPQLEKLHATVNEWQTIASREFNVSDLSEDLTGLIIDWRRLQLSTWAGLFDREWRYCQKDAASWWYVAYETIVAATMGINSSSGELLQHTEVLLKTLGDFMVSSGLGEYAARLNMLRGFQAHLSALKVDKPQFELVHQALANFNAFHAHFEAPVAAKMSEGRQALEKEVQNVIQVASWKDRNIEVLRQSANSSHQKLLRIVRKYRALLAQSVASIVQGEIPKVFNDYADPSTSLQPAYLSSSDVKVALQAPSIWDERPDRFRNTLVTADLLLKKAHQVQSLFSAPRQLNAFADELELSIAELQRTTPPILTEDNKSFVGHLKTRKRRLLADVLKDVRYMGFQSAVSGKALHLQDSFHTVFARLPALDNNKSNALVEYEFHRLLCTMPTVRDSARQHSDDLTSAETTRSVSLLESILRVSILQRKTLRHHIAMFFELEKIFDQLKNFGLCDALTVKDKNTHDISVGLASASHLKHVLHLGIELLQSQGHQSKADYSDIIALLENRKAEAEELRLSIKDLPLLPPNIQSSDHEAMQAEWAVLTDKLRADVANVSAVHPETRPILMQLMGWTDVQDLHNTQTRSNAHSDPDLSTWIHDLFGTLDTVLASVQDAEKIGAEIQKPSGSAWLLRQQKTLDDALDALRMHAITERMNRLIASLQYLDVGRETPLPLVATMCRFLHPIAEAYRRSICGLIDLSRNLSVQTSRTGYVLAKSFIQIATRGFCSPTEKSQDNAAESGDVESGTGLGEGEGGEDISKEIGDDEDLSEIAQDAGEKNKEKNLEDEKDAVDMADEEIKGELGDASPGSELEEGDDDDYPNEAPEVDEEPGENGLGPSAIDEKMWDGDDSGKNEQEDGSGRGEKTQDESLAAAKQLAESPTDQDDGTVDEPETVAVEEEESGRNIDKVDRHVDEETNLNLPEDIQPDESGSMDGVDSDLESLQDDQNEEGDATLETSENENGTARDEDLDNEKASDSEAMDAQAAQGGHEELGDHEDDATSETPLQQPQDTAMDDTEDGAVFGAGGAGTPIEERAGERDRIQNDSKEGMQEHLPDHPREELSDGSNTGTKQGDVASHDAQDASDAYPQLPFQQLGDILEQWYNQHRNIHDARQPQEASDSQQQYYAMDTTRARLEHLPNEEALADTQALGAASTEQSTKLNDDNANEVQDSNEDTAMLDDNMFNKKDHNLDVEPRDEPMQLDPTDHIQEVAQPTSFVGKSTGADVDTLASPSELPDAERDEVEDVDERLTHTHISLDRLPSELSFDDARTLWIKHQERTRNLALILTEHLRLILQPTQATKMRGDFRTGKRLNIRRIIPYIASSYKRDKIWMRRSVPTKRSYQVMLAIDDSKSMTDNKSSDLAFDTLALIAKSMSMLEVGELSVVGFGEHVKTAQDFNTAFTTDAGAKVFQHFTFSQDKTDVKSLLAESIDLFRTARLKSTGSSADLWQLQLIISDGICDDHSSIRQLVRQAHDERVMIVFIVIDSTVQPTSSTSGHKQSILDLQTAAFVKDESGDMQLEMSNYLDTFPFHHYLIVRNVQELPGVLAGALRQWFSEVADTSG